MFFVEMPCAVTCAPKFKGVKAHAFRARSGQIFGQEQQQSEIARIVEIARSRNHPAAPMYRGGEALDGLGENEGALEYDGRAGGKAREGGLLQRHFERVQIVRPHHALVHGEDAELGALRLAVPVAVHHPVLGHGDGAGGGVVVLEAVQHAPGHRVHQRHRAAAPRRRPQRRQKVLVLVLDKE
jgi:hypothetical protein